MTQFTLKQATALFWWDTLTPGISEVNLSFRQLYLTALYFRTFNHFKSLKYPEQIQNPFSHTELEIPAIMGEPSIQKTGITNSVNSYSCYLHLMLMFSPFILTLCYTSKHSYRELWEWGFTLLGLRAKSNEAFRPRCIKDIPLRGEGWKHHIHL